MGAGATVRRWLRLAIKLTIVAVVIGIIVYRFQFAPVDVAAYRAVKGDVVAQVMGTGTLEARVRATISPRISGRLAQVLADQSDRVTKGQLLAVLDDGDLRQQVEVARAELAAAKAAEDRIVADIAGAEATAVLARSEHGRAASLQKSGIASQYEFDTSIERRTVAEANLTRAKAAKVEAERQASKAQESLRYYEERLADTRITAPFDGLVVRRSSDPGDVVVPGGSILDLVSTDQLWVSAWVDETAMGQLAIGQAAKIVFRSEPSQTFPGKVLRLAPQTDRETREFVVDVGADQLPKTWTVGQRAEVYIETGRRDGVLVLPQRLILWREGQAGVVLDDGGQARWQKISLGIRGRETVEVVAGLAESQIVISVPAGGNLPREGRAISHGEP